MFTSYLILMVIDMAWHPLKISQGIWIEPWLLSLRICAAVESVSIVSRQLAWKEWRYLLFMLLSLGVGVSWLAFGFFDAGDIKSVYLAIRQHVHVATAALCLIFLIYWEFRPGRGWEAMYWAVRVDRERDERALGHLKVLTAYLTTRAVVSFFRAGTLQLQYYYEMRIWSLAALACCLACWIWFAFPVRSRRRLFQNPDPSR